MTHLQTVQVMADLLYEMGDADVAVVSDGTFIGNVANTTGVSGTYQVVICAGDYDPEVYTDGEDTGIIVSDAYLNGMEGKTLAAPGRLCR